MIKKWKQKNMKECVMIQVLWILHLDIQVLS